MAERIPKYVETANVVGGPSRRASASTLGSYGVEIQRSAAILKDRNKTLKLERDTVHANQALEAFYDEERAKLTELGDRRGTDAYGAHDEADEWYNIKIAEYGGGLGSLDAQRMFEAKANAHRQSGLNGMALHEVKEHNEAKASSLTNLINATRQKIIEGSTAEAVEEAVEEYDLTSGIYFPGVDNSTEVDKVKLALYITHMEEIALENPERLPDLMERWGDDVPAKELARIAGLAKEKNKENIIGDAYAHLRTKWGENVYAMIEEISDPNNFEEYGIDIDMSRELVTMLRVDRDNYEHNESRTEDKIKKQLAENDFTTYVQEEDLGISTKALIQLAKDRKITQGAFLGIMALKRMKAQSGGDIKDNDAFFVEIYSDLAVGKDIMAKAMYGRKKGLLSRKTFQSLVKEQKNDDFKEGLNHLNQALKPTILDRWSMDKNVRYTDALKMYRNEIEKLRDPENPRGGKPIDAAEEVVRLYTHGLRRTFRGVRAPRLLDGEKNNLGDLEEALRRTVESYQAGDMQVEEFEEEIKIIDQLKEMVQELAELQVQAADAERKRR